MIQFEFEDRVDAFLASDRQWLRDQRIAHYHLQLKAATNDEDKKFWTACYNRVKKD